MMRLAENIRSLRKERSLTQEQLAEVLDVTVGAVYKWEAKLSLPELPLIMEMADFFDTSVDVLLGYEMKDNRLSVTVDRLKMYRHKKDQEGLVEAEKALKKYPNSFQIVHESAVLNRVFGIELHKKDLLVRALELLERSRILLSQNTDPKISDLSLLLEMADVYLTLGKREEALGILKANNADGINSDIIGFTLSEDEISHEDAIPYLSEALLKITLSLIRTVFGYVNVFFSKKDYASAKDILVLCSDYLSGLRDGDTPSFLDKVNAILQVCLAKVEMETSDITSSRSFLMKAKEMAESFDLCAEYDPDAIRFIHLSHPSSAYDDLGETAIEGIKNVLKDIESEELTKMWMEVAKNE